MSQAREYLFVTVKRDENVDRYVENWWTHVKRVNVTGEYDLDVWRSDRTGNDAAYDAEIAVGRLASGLYGATHEAMEDDYSDEANVKAAFMDAFERVQSLGSKWKAYGDVVTALRNLDAETLAPGDAVFARTDVYGVAKSTVDAEFVSDNSDGTYTLRHRSGDEFTVAADDVARA